MPRSPARRLPFLLLLLLLHTTSCQTPPGVEVGAGAAAPVQGELYHRVEQAVEERTIDEQDEEGRSLLLAAALQNDVASAHLLLALLHRAAAGGGARLVQRPRHADHRCQRERPRYRCHLGCILLKMPAISLLTGARAGGDAGADGAVDRARRAAAHGE